jgi:hypothetical protein
LPRQARLIRACIETEEVQERTRTRPRRRHGLSSPRPAAVAAAITVIEVRAGVRSPWHLERLSHYSLWPVWDTFAQPAASDLTATAAQPLVVLVQEPVPGLVNATVIVRFASRVEPVGLRLDGARGWWELIELECLPDNAPPTPTDLASPAAPIAREHGDAPFLGLSPERSRRLPSARPQRWPHPDLARDLDSLDTPGVELS